MRYLDQLRTHPVPSSEKEEYNIPDDRVVCTSSKSVLQLCGSNKGVRFSTADVVSSRLIAASMEEKFGGLDEAFKALTQAEKKTKGSELSKTELTAGLRAYKEIQDEFLETCGRLALLVARKRKELVDDPPPPFEVDPEAEMKLAMPLPLYLQNLIDKYESETSPSKPHPSLALDSVARFSAFLAACVTGEVWCSTEEGGALRVLVGASDDRSDRPPFSDAYWRRRFFNFLSKVRELKSAPKKEKMLEEKYVWEERDKGGADNDKGTGTS